MQTKIPGGGDSKGTRSWSRAEQNDIHSRQVASAHLLEQVLHLFSPECPRASLLEPLFVAMWPDRAAVPADQYSLSVSGSQDEQEIRVYSQIRRACHVLRASLLPENRNKLCKLAEWDEKNFCWYIHWYLGHLKVVSMTAAGSGRLSHDLNNYLAAQLTPPDASQLPGMPAPSASSAGADITDGSTVSSVTGRPRSVPLSRSRDAAPFRSRSLPPVDPGLSLKNGESERPANASSAGADITDVPTVPDVTKRACSVPPYWSRHGTLSQSRSLQQPGSGVSPKKSESAPGLTSLSDVGSSHGSLPFSTASNVSGLTFLPESIVSTDRATEASNYSRVQNLFKAFSYFSCCRPVSSESCQPVFVGDTDGSSSAVLYALHCAGKVSFTDLGVTYLEALLKTEDKLIDAVVSLNLIDFAKLIVIRDSTLNLLIPCVQFIIKPDPAIVFAGDFTGDRLSSITSDLITLYLMRAVGAVALAGDHETCFNGNFIKYYCPQLTETFNEYPSERIFDGIKTLNICYYNDANRTLVSHNGIIFEEGEGFRMGPYRVADEMPNNQSGPAWLCDQFNKLHRNAMNSRDAWQRQCGNHDYYASESIEFRPSKESLLSCASRLGVLQIYGHNGSGEVTPDMIKKNDGSVAGTLGLNSRVGLNAGTQDSDTPVRWMALFIYQPPETVVPEQPAGAAGTNTGNMAPGGSVHRSLQGSGLPSTTAAAPARHAHRHTVP